MVPSVLGQIIIGHRGASHDAPENTLAAFRLALEQNADGFEADFYLTADGQILCLHDADTKRVGGKKLLVKKAAFDALRALDVGSWKGPKWKGEKMPTMEEVFAAVPAGKKIFIELKSGPEVVGPMVKLIEASSLSPGQIVIISFHADAIAECKKQLPHIKAHWLSRFKKKEGDDFVPPTIDEVIATLRRSKADGLGAEAIPDYVDAAFLTKLRDSGYEFHVWTVDDPEVARFYQKLGTLGITTNRPGYIREQLENGAGG